MSWKEKLRQNPSKAEIAVLIGLEKRGLTKGMYRDVKICLMETIPDFWFPSQRLPVYLDGPPHEKDRQRLKDEFIDEKLRKKGLRPLRIPYKPPLSKRKLNEILDEIEEALNS